MPSTVGRHGLMPGAQFLRATFLNVGRWCSARVLLSAGRLVVLNKMSASKNGQGCRKKTEVGHECLRLKKKSRGRPLRMYCGHLLPTCLRDAASIEPIIHLKPYPSRQIVVPLWLQWCVVCFLFFRNVRVVPLLGSMPRANVMDVL